MDGIDDEVVISTKMRDHAFEADLGRLSTASVNVDKLDKKSKDGESSNN